MMFRVALALLGLYFYSQDNALWIPVGFVFTFSFLQQQLAAIWRVLINLPDVRQQHNANSALTYTFRLERVFEHPALDMLFGKLHEHGKARRRHSMNGASSFLRTTAASMRQPNGGYVKCASTSRIICCS